MSQHNTLFPVFFRLDRMKVLLVGAGEVGYEKLFFMLKSSPVTTIKIVAPEINPKLSNLIAGYPNTNFSIDRRKFEASDVANCDIILAATNNKSLNQEVWSVAKEKGKLINVADTPDLCDFYLGSIVTKGDLKIAISTNGKSPTLAKRIRQTLEEIFPDDIHELLQKLHVFRKGLKLHFEQKVEALNKMTQSMIEISETK